LLSNTGFIEFDANNLPASPDFNISNPSLNLQGLCIVEYYDCSQIDTHCLTCISHSLCSSCNATYYVQTYPNVTSVCLLCANALVGCYTCTNTSACLTCLSPTNLLNVTSELCYLCGVSLPNCLNCSNDTTCTGCNPYYGLNGTDCGLCATMLAGCELCTSSTNCTQCYSGYYLDTGACLPCYNGVPNCAICSSSTICTYCYSDSYLGPGNTSCLCNSPKVSVSNLCAQVGCASAYRFGTTTFCMACNTSQHFEYVNGSCTCQLGYSASNSTCLLVCGDGRQLT
jgi:proprotein convertase subtilisin/kexin type 5